MWLFTAQNCNHRSINCMHQLTEADRPGVLGVRSHPEPPVEFRKMDSAPDAALSILPYSSCHQRLQGSKSSAYRQQPQDVVDSCWSVVSTRPYRTSLPRHLLLQVAWNLQTIRPSQTLR